MNGQNDDKLESRTTDGYKRRLELLCYRLKYNGHQTVYTAVLLVNVCNEDEDFWMSGY